MNINQKIMDIFDSIFEKRLFFQNFIVKKCKDDESKNLKIWLANTLTLYNYIFKIVENKIKDELDEDFNLYYLTYPLISSYKEKRLCLNAVQKEVEKLNLSEKAKEIILRYLCIINDNYYFANKNDPIIYGLVLNKDIILLMGLFFSCKNKTLEDEEQLKLIFKLYDELTDKKLSEKYKQKSFYYDNQFNYFYIDKKFLNSKETISKIIIIFKEIYNLMFILKNKL